MDSFEGRRLSPPPSTTIRCLVVPEGWSGELWPVGMALCVDPTLVVVLTFFPSMMGRNAVSASCMQMAAFFVAVAPGRVVLAWQMSPERDAHNFNREFVESLNSGADPGLSLAETGLALKPNLCGCTLAGLENRALFYSAAAATQFYSPFADHFATVAMQWSVLCGDVNDVVALVPNTKMILVWYRDPKLGEPHQDFTVGRHSYGVDWLALVDSCAAEAGFVWTTVGGIPSSRESYGSFRAVDTLNNLWGALPTVDECKGLKLRDRETGRTNRLIQFALFYNLARRENVVALTWRSGSAEGCFLFTGIPTVILDHRRESGFKRAATMCSLMSNAHHVDVDAVGRGGADSCLRRLVGLEGEDPNSRGRERGRGERDDRERDYRREEKSERRERSRSRERVRRCAECNGMDVVEECRQCRAMVCGRCYRSQHGKGFCVCDHRDCGSIDRVKRCNDCRRYVCEDCYYERHHRGRCR